MRSGNGAALLIIDMINRLDFPGASALLRHALPVAARIAQLKRRLKALGLPVIYVNDNFGQWQSDWQKVFAACVQSDSLGAPLAQRLLPEPDDYFILKPKHSGFYGTTLEVLLENLGVRTLILTGIAGNLCVLFTANDAHMRDFAVCVPHDCVASNTVRENRWALGQLGTALGIDIRSSRALTARSLRSLAAASARKAGRETGKGVGTGK